MNEQEQRIAIAEACGWEDCGMGWWRHEGIGDRLNPPDYLHDLDAMHEAEKVLTEHQQELYGGFLHSGRLCLFNAYCTEWSWNLIHATAAQRAEAFLRTIGKWKD